MTSTATPDPAILQALTSWLIRHSVGIADEPNTDDTGTPVDTSEKAMASLAAMLLTKAPGMRPAALTTSAVSTDG